MRNYKENINFFNRQFIKNL